MMNIPNPKSCPSVSQLTDYIKSLLTRDRTLEKVSVIGEISGYRERTGHLYFDLKDSQGKSVIKCVVWSDKKSKLHQLPENGKEVIISGKVDVYVGGGYYQINVQQIFPTGEGLQALKYQQLRDKLTAEGLFDPRRKRSLPHHPQIIGVVTSPQAAAWGDIKVTISGRYPGFHVILSPATVQGVSAPNSIIEAIKRIEKDGRAEVIIIARGGGSAEDISCFNDEKLVRKIALCSIPIVTGIAHERDETLADLAADVKQATPTAAAQFVVPDIKKLSQEHEERLDALKLALNKRFEREFNRLEKSKIRLQNVPKSQQLNKENYRYQVLREKLQTLSPEAVLNRGYAIIQSPDGEIVRNTDNLFIGQPLTIRLNQGKIQVKIIEIQDNEVSSKSK